MDLKVTIVNLDGGNSMEYLSIEADMTKILTKDALKLVETLLRKK